MKRDIKILGMMAIGLFIFSLPGAGQASAQPTHQNDRDP